MCVDGIYAGEFIRRASSGTRLLVFTIFGFYSSFQLRALKPKPKQLLTSYTTQPISNGSKTKTCTHLTQRLFLTNVWNLCAFFSPEATLLLVSTKSHHLWAGPHRKSAIHRFSVKSDKSDWLRTRNENSANTQRSRFLVLTKRSADYVDENDLSTYTTELGKGTLNVSCSKTQHCP